MILRNALPYRTKVNASRTVDLPAPFDPMIRVVLWSFSFNRVGWFPVDRKFFQEIFSKIITSVVGGNYNVIRGDHGVLVVVVFTSFDC